MISRSFYLPDKKIIISTHKTSKEFLVTIRDSCPVNYTSSCHSAQYTHIYAYIRIYTHTYAYTHIYTHTRAYKRIYTHLDQMAGLELQGGPFVDDGFKQHTSIYTIYTHIHACARIYAHIHAYTPFIHIYTHTHIHAYACMYTHIHAYTRIYMHIHAYTRIYTHFDQMAGLGFQGGPFVSWMDF